MIHFINEPLMALVTMKHDLKWWLKRSWRFVWHDDSMLSWIVNILLAFVLIKFILYPAVGFVLGTQLPVVAVVSSSMDHRFVDGVMCGQSAIGDAEWWAVCGEWYEERGFSQADFDEFVFRNGFWKGDIMFVLGAKPGSVKVGDVLVFSAGKEYPIIHRVVRVWQEGGNWFYATKGDHNEEQIQEYVISDGLHLYRCYQETEFGILTAPCNPGVDKVDSETPGARLLMDETRIPQDRVIGKAIGRLPFLGFLKIWFVDLLNLLGMRPATQIF